ncbi:L,D-transpeptidase [Sulfurimonas sp.]|uniref:L,D-transpeptidase n=1 Tax=Sulfurimonas sp. TaxID=2022749 RepID=UPI002B49BCA3|nr:L,D-transpeptidase [Sulfurimonas sp.]
MATMEFNKTTGVLSWLNFGTWTARSGNWSKPLPNGLYTVERRKITPISSKMKKGFLDNKTGKGFFVPLTAHFDLHGRHGFGIHPDGSPDGTHGCIGLINNSFGFYNSIASTAVSANITLLVSGS